MNTTGSSRTVAMRAAGSLLGIVAVAAFVLNITGTARATEDLNVIGWCDITDPELNGPFEEAFDVRINVKVHEDPAVAQTLIEQSAPGDWDVFHTDATLVPTHVEAGLLAELDPNDFPLDDIFPQVLRRDLHFVDGKLYAVPDVFGWNTVAYNSDRVDAADIRSYDIAWNPKYEGRIAVWDFYVQIMQNVGLAMGLAPDEITMDNLGEVEERLLAMKKNVGVIGDIATIQTALATGDADIVLGGGQWIVTGLQEENPELDWIVPEEGGIFYLESVGVVASSEKQELAREYVKYLTSAVGQGRFAMNSCGMAMPANSKAELTDDEKALLRWDQKDGFLEDSHINHYYDQELDAAMVDAWARFLQH